jgi:lysozyme
VQLSPEGLKLLKQSEGYRGQVYLDAAGHPTIGYGHRLLPSQSFPEGITEQQATEILLNDVCEAERAVSRLVRVPLAQGQFDALVDFCFNLGQNRLAASSLLDCLNRGRYSAAAEQLLLWDHAGHRELAALRARREAEFHLWHKPCSRPAVCRVMLLPAAWKRFPELRASTLDSVLHSTAKDTFWAGL